MLEKVKQYAMEKYAGDVTLAEEFVKGFEKQAADQGFGSSLVGALGKGVGGVAMGLGIHGLNLAFSEANRGALHTQFLSSLAKAVSSNRILREADKTKVQQYAETIFRFAPHVAGDSNLLSSILANAIHGEGIDPMTIKTLGDLESRYVENRMSGGFSPKTYV